MEKMLLMMAGGITKEISEDFFRLGVDVITSGNHIWDKKETADFIEKKIGFYDLPT